jgi:hypothetical protein
MAVHTVLAREVLVRARGVREIHTVVSEDNPASLGMLGRLGELRSDCVAGSCEVVVRLDCAGAVATVDSADRVPSAVPGTALADSIPPADPASGDLAHEPYREGTGGPRRLDRQWADQWPALPRRCHRAPPATDQHDKPRPSPCRRG